ncbi:ABC transporter ATP-binding protein [Candidatus Saccharibacteria bacterium]|nr:ABC transporter ATP-binding protein [Candidatus Saccharibacteria bacterium]
MSARRKSSINLSKLTVRQYLHAMLQVGATTYKAAPQAAIVQAIGSLVTAILPLVVTFYVAATTSALARAYAGENDAGAQAITYVIITAVLGVIMTAWRSLENYLSQTMRYKIEAAMTDRMYEHFLKLDFWRYDDKDTVDLYDKARKFGQFFPYIFERLSTMLTAMVSMIAGVVALAFVSWWLALVAFVAIIPGLIIQLRLSRMQTRHWNQNIKARRVVSWIEWGIMQPDKIAELRLYGLVRHLLDLRQVMRDKDEKARIAFERTYIWKRFGADVIEAAAEVTALTWVTLQIIARQQPIGQFIYVQQVVSRALSGASSLVGAVSSIDEDIANLFDYQKFMDLPEGTHGDTEAIDLPQVIELRDVSFRYPNSEVMVLKHVSFKVTRGQHIAIVGENGAGKSTLMKILTGLYVPTSGEVYIDGVSLQVFNVASWHRMLGVLSQEFVKYDFANAKDNITLGDVSKPLNVARLEKAVQQAEAGFLYKLPQGLDNYVDQWMEDNDGHKGQDLSGGQWQRLALARNFYRDAPIIILDEPTSAIDALAESRIFKHLFSLKDKTIIAVSHRLTTVQKADIVYMLQDGVVVERGTVEELIAAHGEFYTMFESQIK